MKAIRYSGVRLVLRALSALLPALLMALTGCGGGGGSSTKTGSGGGGGGTTTVTNLSVIGRVLVAETGNPPVDSSGNPTGSITIGSQTVKTAADGTFTLNNVSTKATTGTVAATGEITRTLALVLPTTITTATSYDLGDIYISSSAYAATASGTVVTPVSGQNQPVGGASVTVAGSTVLTATNGTFTITGLPVGIGGDSSTQIGVVRATKYSDKPIYSPLFPLAAGANDLGTLIIQSPVGTAPPTLPYTITGKVVEGSNPATGISVAIISNGVELGTPVITDANGNYYFWVVPGTYSIFAVGTGGTEYAPSPPTVTLAAANQPVTVPTITVH